MIQNTKQYEITSTIPTTNRVAMGIREEDMSKIMGILVDLYKNKLLACIREYSTNALDAIIDAGKDPLKHPVRVSLPSPLSPFLIIEDEGIGLSETDIREVYSKYGRSTKDTRNDVVGMLGLGGKSALTYTSQFTVTSRKGGEEIVVIVSREGDGSGACSTIGTGKTDKPDGTEIKIPINRPDYDRAGTLARQFFSYWTEGTVLVDGDKPKRFAGLRVTDDLFVTDEYGQSKVVMGNVAYPAPELDDLCPRGSVVAYVPIGSVEFPPNRESLQEHPNTTATLEDIRKRFAKEIKGAVQREIDKADTPQEAINLAVKWDSYVPEGGSMTNRTTTLLSGYTYKGGPIPAFIETDQWEDKIVPYSGGKIEKVQRPFITSQNGHYRLGASNTNTRLYAQEWKGAVFVTGYTPAKFNANHKKKMQSLVTTKNIGNVHVFVMVPGDLPDAKVQPGVNFIDKSRILDWEDVKKVQLAPRYSRGSSGRIPGSYDFYTEDGFNEGVPGDKIRQNQPIFYMRGNRYQAGAHKDMIAKFYPKFTIVALSANRVEKFKRNVPKARMVKDAVSEQRDGWVKGLTADDKRALWLADNYIEVDMDPAKINDPALKQAAKLYRDGRAGELQKMRKAFDRVCIGRCQIDYGKQTDPCDKYPLFDAISEDDHGYAYLNWVHGGCK